jgi:spore germination protein GerM
MKIGVIRRTNITLMLFCVLFIAILLVSDMPAQESEKPEDVVTMNLKLYYLGTDGNTYVSEDREVTKYGNTTDQAKIALMELIRGPVTDLMPTIPKGTDVREVFIDKRGCAYIDFTGTISSNHIGGVTAEMATIVSIVNTLTANFPKNIQKVRILINGKEAKTIAGHIDITKPILPF